MAETAGMPTSESRALPPFAEDPKPPKAKAQQPRPPSRFQQLNKLYALPAPLRTFPLPTFVPHNPLSLFHILFVWAQQTISPQSSHFPRLYEGYFSPDTRSVHVTDIRSVRGLWEQGFYGKGNLSRSEPSWLEREKKRRGEGKSITSEDVTKQRRAERQQTKWERARKEREAIDLKLSEEAQAESRRWSETPPVPAPLPKSPTKHIENSSNSEVLVQEVRMFEEPFQRTSSPPVDPLRLLSLPNSSRTLRSVPEVGVSRIPINGKSIPRTYAAPVGPLEILAMPDSNESYAMLQRIMVDHCVAVETGAQRTINGKPPSKSSESVTSTTKQTSSPGPQSCDEMTNGHAINGHANGMQINGAASGGWTDARGPVINGAKGSPSNNGTLISEINAKSITGPGTSSTSIHDASPNGSALANGRLSPKIKRRKSVRFSPQVEETTFIRTEPPSPERRDQEVEEVTKLQAENQPLQNQEHYQLNFEEAFFLAYSLGALTIFSPTTNLPIPTSDLFTLFRQYAQFPQSSKQDFAPDDPFLVSYVVYHHFRSLGWVVRGGTKFSVDYLLYIRGPVFTHAEFAVIILPSYSAPYWSNPDLREYVKSKEKRSWSWLHCVNRVITQVKKTLILVYVDIPEPADEEALGIDGVLGRYKVREIVLKRWTANRSRD